MKQIKKVSLMLFAICCAMVLRINVNAEEIILDKDTASSDIEITEGMVIDGQGKYTITGGLSIKNGMDVTIKNVTLDGEGKTQITLNLSGAGNVVVENVTFKNYTSKGIYTNNIESLKVSGSTFDASYAKDLETGNELVKRSAAGIDINFGDNITSDYTIGNIEIIGNSFKNVVDTEPVEASTAGAIKIKIKDNRHLVSLGTITISGNAFTDNVRDIVIGTNDPATGSSMTALDTGKFDFILKNNGTVKVSNNTTEDKKVSNVNGDYIINYGENTIITLDTSTEDVYEKVEVTEEVDLNEKLTEIKNNDMLEGVTLSYPGYTITISKENIKDDLKDTLTDLSMEISDKTEVKALEEYAKEGVLFITTTESGVLPATKVTVTTVVDGEYEKLLLYYFNEETEKLEFVDEVAVKDGIVSFDLEHYSNYVLSATDLIEEENPNTYDGIMVYVMLGLLAIVALSIVSSNLKRKITA